MFMLSLMQPSGLYELEKDSLEAISAQLLQMIQMKSYHLYTHSIQVSNYAVSIAAKMGLPLNEIEQIRHAALLHDVGLLMVPNALIQKSPYLNKQEMSKYKQHAASGANMIENYPCCQQIMKLHTTLGAKALQKIIDEIKEENKFLNIAKDMAHYHHEKWDGSGYPKHLRGANIPLGARIIAVADYYDTTVNPSTEFWAKTKAKAKEELFSASGSLFDPDVVKAFIDVLG